MLRQELDEKAIFGVAVSISDQDARRQYLRQACGDNDVLKDRVKRLLRMQEEEPSFLETPDRGNAATILSPEHTLPHQDQSRIGPYKIREKLAEGGMGIVYVAEQVKPVRRKVALKLVKPGATNPDTLARFEAERQALAMMDHPNIARVFDGSQTDSGQPYFVMELVQGIPITDFCDQQKLTTRERLVLIRDVCRAVQHAHQKGVIHRDLKPSNILVAEIDGEPVPKVIDFGVAKAIHQPLTDQTVYTHFAQMIGTPLYMSPEQASLGVVDIDTRSDVYSLGVLLYELLTGSPPFDREAFRQATFDEIRRIVREDVPCRPSHIVSTLRGEALSTVADRRQADERRLQRDLRGELDWITLKSLEKDRARRYQSASEMADDLQNYLDGQAVEACPPSWTYRTRTFARRHRTMLAGAGIVAVLLLGGIATTSWQLLRAIEAEKQASQHATLAQESAREAKRESEVASAIIEFLNDDLLGRANPRNETQGDLSVRELLNQATLSLNDRFEDQPEVRAALQETIGRAYCELGAADKAERLLRQSFETRRTHLGDDHLDTLRSGRYLSSALADQGFPDQALSSVEQLVKLSQARWGDNHETTLSLQAQMGHHLWKQGEVAVARAIWQDAHRRAQEHLGRRHELTLTVETNLLALKIRTEPSREHLRELKNLVPVLTEVMGATHPITLMTLQNVATSQYLVGEYAGAHRSFEALLPKYEQLGGRDCPGYLRIQRSIVNCLRELGSLPEAIRLAEELLTRQQAKYPPGHPELLLTANELGQCLSKNYRTQDAEQLLTQQLEAAAISPFDTAELVCELEITLARIAIDQQQYELAVQRFEAIMKSLPDIANGKRALIASNLGVAYAGLGEWAAAETCFREALERYRDTFPPDHPHILTNLGNVRAALQGQGKLAEARKIKSEIERLEGGSKSAESNIAAKEHRLRQRLQQQNEATASRLDALKDLASLVQAQGNYAQAEALYQEAIALYQQLEHDRPELEIELRINHWFAVSQQKRYDDAYALAEQTLSCAQKILPEKHGYLAIAASNLAVANSNFGWKLATQIGASQQDGQRAVTLLRQSVEIEPQKADYWSNLGVAYNLAGKFEDAVAAFEKSDQLRKQPDWQHRLFYAQALKGLGRHDDAVRRYCEGWLWVLGNRGGSSQYQRFLRETEGQLRLDPETRDGALGDYVSQTQLDKSWQWKAAGIWLKDRGEYESAAAEFTRLIKSSEPDQDIFVHSHRGLCYLELGQYDAAIADFSRVLEERHDDAFALRYRGLAHAGLGETALALNDFRQAAASNPDKQPLWKAWGEGIRQHYRPRQYAGVEREWQRTVEIAPTLPQAWFFTSTWLLLVDRSDEYHLMVQRVIEQSADLNGNELARAVVLCALDPVSIQEQDQRQIRLDLAVKAVAEGPTWCRTHAAMVQVRCGQAEDGLAALQSLKDEADSDEFSPLLAAYLALAFQINGDDDAAEKASETVEATDLEAIDSLSIQIQLEVLLHELRTQRPSTAPAGISLQRVD